MDYYKHVSPTTFTHPNTCHDSLEGDCVYGLTRENCMNYCTNNNCTYGVFINKDQLSDKERIEIAAAPESNSICFASLTRAIHPLDLVEETNKDIDLFIKAGAFETTFRGNIDFMDKVFMSTRAGALMFSGQPLQIWKPYVKYVEHLRYGDSINIRKFMTNVYLFANICTAAAEFVYNSSIHFTDELNFFVMSATKSAGDFVQYDDTFYIQTKNKLILTDSLKLVYRDPQILAAAGIQIFFKFSPEFDVYYCNGARKCESAAAAELDNSFKYRGSDTFRSNNCYLNC